MIDEQTSKRITSLRFLLAGFIVFLHIADLLQPFSIDNQTTIYNWISHFISKDFADCAVPLFFVFAAYLQAQKSDTYGTLMNKRVKSLVIPYIFWVSLYLALFSVGKVWVANNHPEILANPDELFYSWTTLDWIHHVIGFSDLYAGAPTAAAHFWFVRDLFLLVAISPLLIRLIKVMPYGIFAIVTLYSILGSCPFDPHLPIALFFYVIGLYWGLYNAKLFEIVDQITYIETCLLFLICTICMYCIPDVNELTKWATTIFAATFTLKVSKQLIKTNRLYNELHDLAHFSFFIYAFHLPIVGTIVVKVWEHFLPMNNSAYLLFAYFGCAILTIVISTIIGILLRKYLPSFFALINGGRK